MADFPKTAPILFFVGIASTIAADSGIEHLVGSVNPDLSSYGIQSFVVETPTPSKKTFGITIATKGSAAYFLVEEKIKNNSLTTKWLVKSVYSAPKIPSNFMYVGGSCAVDRTPSPIDRDPVIAAADFSGHKRCSKKIHSAWTYDFNKFEFLRTKTDGMTCCIVRGD